MRRSPAASGLPVAPYLGAPGAGGIGAGAAPVVPDGMMISATRMSFGSINRTLLPGYRYAIVNDRPVIVEPRSRRIVEIIE